ncbi:MAG: M48 family metallopeptidase [Balneola sp.]
MFRNTGFRTYSIEVEGITIEVTRKRIKNLYVRVNRRSGRIRVSCPVRISEKNLVRFIHSKSEWIFKQLDKAAKVQFEPEFKFISGEEHVFEGRAYTLKVFDGASKSQVFLDNDHLVMKIRGNSGRDKRERLLDDWYRDQLKKSIKKIIEHYQPIMNVEVKEFGVKKMKTRWGTCNIRDQRIWLNLKLAHKNMQCIEMVVVHEMVHLIERLHNKRFYSLMDSFMPDWREADKKLNSFVD